MTRPHKAVSKCWLFEGFEINLLFQTNYDVITSKYRHIQNLWLPVFLPDMAYTRRRFLISVGMIFMEWELGTAFHIGGSQKQNLNGFSVMKDRLET